MAAVRKVSSLVLLRRDGSVLLGYKKRGFGAGKWNGFGGKKEEGETMLQCAKRELLEESGIVSDHLEPVGSLEFEFVQDPMFMDVTVYTARHFTGEPKETEEMRPRWFSEKEIPYSEMWADDQVWFPFFLLGLQFRGRFKFLDNETLTWYDIECMTKPGDKPYKPTNACQRLPAAAGTKLEPDHDGYEAAGGFAAQDVPTYERRISRQDEGGTRTSYQKSSNINLDA